MQQREYFETDFITHDIGHKVAAIGHVGLMKIIKKADNLSTVDA